MIVQNLTAKNGFDSRRRSFARNNLFAFKKMRENSFNLLDKDAILLKSKGIQHQKKLQQESLANKVLSVDHLLACGMPYCKAR